MGYRLDEFYKLCMHVDLQPHAALDFVLQRVPLDGTCKITTRMTSPESTQIKLDFGCLWRNEYKCDTHDAAIKFLRKARDDPIFSDLRLLRYQYDDVNIYDVESWREVIVERAPA